MVAEMKPVADQRKGEGATETPNARMAAIAKEESSSSASMAPCVAMMALATPQTAEPTARSVVSLGRRPRRAAEERAVKAVAPVISRATKT